MELFVLDKSFQTVAIIDEFESLIWTDRYRECGDFELYVSANTDILSTVQVDYYLTCKESEHMMIVEGVKIDTDVESGNHITISGRSLESILDRRIIWPQTNLTGTLSDGLQTLINNAIISPSDTSRQISNFKYITPSEDIFTSTTLDKQYTGDNLYDTICCLCEEYDFGFKITLNSSNEFEFLAYKGIDRSYEQSNRPYVIFSPGYENIINTSYTEDKSTLKNVTVVAGEDQGASRKYTTVTQSDTDVTGLNRREVFTDARDISSDTDEGTLSDTQYTSLLTSRGESSLAENIETKDFTGQVEATRMFKYKEDFLIGDIVQIVNEYGIEGQAYITEIITSQDSNGISQYPTFEML